MKKQQVLQLYYKGLLHTQLSQSADTLEELLLDSEVMFGEELNRKLTEWLMNTEEIRDEIAKMTLKEFEAFED